MDNFTFYNPARIHFGKGQIAELANEIPANQRVLITYGSGSIKRNGVLDEVKSALAEHQVFEFGGIEANPHYETLLSALDIIKAENIDFLLAVGGGSVIDGTKFLAAAAKYTGDSWGIIESRGATVKDALPMGCVLTLAATGSEMNNCSVITKQSTQDKLFFFNDLVIPRFSILDPATNFSLPRRQSANGVVDAFVHIVEQYVTYPVDAKVQDAIAEGLLKVLITEGPKLLDNPEDYNARANIIWSATMALNGILRVGVPGDWASHMIGQEITALHGLDHAQTLAVMLPAVWKYKKQDKLDKLVQYAANVWGISGNDHSDIADRAIAATQTFFEQMGVPTRLADYGLDEAIIPEILVKLEEHSHVGLGERGDIGLADAEQILRLAK